VQPGEDRRDVVVRGQPVLAAQRLGRSEQPRRQRRVARCWYRPGQQVGDRLQGDGQIAPVVGVAALAIKLEDRGSVIHRSRRVGVEESVFTCLKLRTMREGAEREQEGLEELNEAAGALFKIREDPRVTRVGRVLRRYSIDELPQLWNVVRGDMSLVGPRPLPTRDYERLDDLHRKRYLILPGLTGLWQVSGRSDLSFDELVRLDFYYIETWSIWLDLTILARTVPVVLRRKGAY
jgi:lipopolysaccharide/colanic/teichoic acid biosynthesis glycosyltransferase